MARQKGKAKANVSPLLKEVTRRMAKSQISRTQEKLGEIGSGMQSRRSLNFRAASALKGAKATAQPWQRAAYLKLFPGKTPKPRKKLNDPAALGPPGQLPPQPGPKADFELNDPAAQGPPDQLPPQPIKTGGPGIKSPIKKKKIPLPRF